MQQRARPTALARDFGALQYSLLSTAGTAHVNEVSRPEPHQTASGRQLDAFNDDALSVNHVKQQSAHRRSGRTGQDPNMAVHVGQCLTGSHWLRCAPITQRQNHALVPETAHTYHGAVSRRGAVSVPHRIGEYFFVCGNPSVIHFGAGFCIR